MLLPLPHWPPWRRLIPLPPWGLCACVDEAARQVRRLSVFVPLSLTVCRAWPSILGRSDKLGGALRATLKIGEARARDITHISRLVLANPVYFFRGVAP